MDEPGDPNDATRVRAAIAAEGGGIRGVFRALLARLRGERSPLRLGVSVGLGFFIGCLPVYGLHLPMCLVVCLPLRLDAVAAYLAANVSNPFVAPFLLFASAQIGSLILTGAPLELDLDSLRDGGALEIAASTVLGSVVLGAVLGVVGGSIAAWLASRRATPSALDAAIARTVARYGNAPRADRHYVRWKLRLDPVLREIATLGELGDVVDAGSGRGQLGACLWELGVVRTLAGFDHDDHKVTLARAAFPEASFSAESAETYAFPAADTILFIDVLHYLDPDAQDRVLERAASSLRPDGRLIVREVEDARRGSSLTRLFERIGLALGVNRGQKFAFRPLSEIVERLTSLGFECERRDASSGTPLSNALVVANYRPRAAAGMLKS
jgi:uncharacterized protein (DUF2062 family)/SAM-dependent methyltransferase